MSDEEGYTPLRTERDRGIFTTADREYLLGERELSEQAERNTRYRIRDRLKNGIYDFSLANRLRTEDRKQVAEAIFTDEFTSDSVIHDSLGLLFSMVTDTEEGEPSNAIEKFEEILSSVIKVAIKREKDDVMVDVDVSIETKLQKPDINELLNKYENNEESFKEFKFLRENDKIEYGDEFLRHAIRHRWEKNAEFSIFTSEGEMKSIDPSNYDSLQQFIEAGVEMKNEIERNFESN
jgi:hypothetical protein